MKCCINENFLFSRIWLLLCYWKITVISSFPPHPPVIMQKICLCCATGFWATVIGIPCVLCCLLVISAFFKPTWDFSCSLAKHWGGGMQRYNITISLAIIRENVPDQPLPGNTTVESLKIYRHGFNLPEEGKGESSVAVAVLKRHSPLCGMRWSWGPEMANLNSSSHQP